MQIQPKLVRAFTEYKIFQVCYETVIDGDETDVVSEYEIHSVSGKLVSVHSTLKEALKSLFVVGAECHPLNGSSMDYTLSKLVGDGLALIMENRGLRKTFLYPLTQLYLDQKRKFL